MVIHVNLKKHDYEVISIPRDTSVYLPGYGYTKITHANFLGELKGGLSVGTKDAIQAISNLTGLPINYFAETVYWGLQDMVDAIGGINMYVPETVKITHPWYSKDAGEVFTQGEHFVTGQQVTEIVHEYYSLQNGDFDRQQDEEEAVLGMAKALLNPDSITKLPQFARSLSEFLVTTNMIHEDMVSMGIAMKGFESSQVHYYQVPGHSAYLPDPVVKLNLYYWIADEQALGKIIQSHFEG